MELKNKKKLLSLFVLVSTVLFVGLIGAITFQQIAPTTNPFVTPDNTVNLSLGVHCPDGCSSFTESWNGTNTTIFDYQWVLGMNFDNRSSLGENDTFVRDISMYGNNGTVIGGENITWGAGYGKYGGAFNFSGKLSSINASLSLVSPPELTLSVWIYVPLVSNPSTNHRILDKSAGTSAEKGFSLFFAGGAANHTLFKLNGTGTLNSGTNSIPRNTWTHVVVTVNSLNVTNIYVNSVNVSQEILSNSTECITTSNNLYIGSRIGADRFFNGSIDDVMIFNRSLSATEIGTLYRTQVTKFNESYFEYNLSNTNTSAFTQNSFICSKNATADVFCSTSQNIRKLNTLVSNFSTSQGTINDYFYGSNTHGGYLSPSWNSVTYLWSQNVYLNSGMKYIRADMGFNAYATSEGTYDSARMLIYQELVTWAKLNNIKIVWIASYTPEWLANKTSGWCTLTGSNNKTCPPSNYTKWGILITDFLTDTGCTPEVCEVEVWNEPNLAEYWLNNLTVTTNKNRIDEYNRLYNASYLAVKVLNSSYQVGGPSVTGKSSGTAMFMINWMGNFSDEIDFVTYHDYLGQGSFTDFHSAIADDYLWIKANLTNKNINISKILFDEYNVWNGTIRENYTNIWDMQMGLAFESALNIDPVNISMIQYQFSSEYANDYQMINYSNYIFYSSYNVTKNFAHLCPAGGNVWQHENDGECVKWTTCSKGNMFSMIGVNSCNYSQNYTANLSMENGTVIFPYTSIMNYETGASIPVTSQGIIQLGVLDSYEVLYLTSGDEDGGTLVNLFKFNEATGTKVYDLLQNASDGTISGASWINDSILITLSAVQYTIDLVTGLLTLDTDYLYEYLFVDYDYNKLFGFHVSILGVIAGFLMIIVLGVGIIYVVKYFKNIKELE